MYIIQMADLHIGSSEPTVPEEKEFLEKSVELIKERIPENEKILICLCGDIIDSKNTSTDKAKSDYETAAGIIGAFVNSLEDDYQVMIKCCPGNHDATHMDELTEFVKKVDKDTPPSRQKLGSCYTISEEDENIIFVNSCHGDQYQKGSIDYEALETELSRVGVDKKKIIVLHHTVMSMFEDDASPIRNAAKLVNLIDKYNVIGVLHGHIHGREILTLGEQQCKIVGTGALLSRGNPNVNSQFNIIEIKKNIFLKILNCRYHADGGNDPWDVEELNHSNVQNIFMGDRFSEVYGELINALSVSTPIYNMRMEINSTYENFERDLNTFFRTECLKIGNIEWEYPQLAKMWQAEIVPEELYFNHGSYFKVGEQNGIEYVVESLKRKPTSNRIVLPTYNMENVNQSLDDKNYLPSLVSIQFGKNDKILIVHMHLRALEANRFLKINICEIQYLINQIRARYVEFDDVKVIISAFRVQRKEKFNCFLKAQIDMMAEEKLTTYVNFKNFEKLYWLFVEKKDAKETITKVNGVDKVYKAMQASNKVMEECGGEPIYSTDIIKMLKELLDKYKELDGIHKASSIQSEKENECEEKIDELLDQIIKKLAELKEVDD